MGVLKKILIFWAGHDISWTFEFLTSQNPPWHPPGVGWVNFFRFESVPYLSEYVCQIWLRSDGRECNAGMTIAKCTKTAVSSNDSNHLSSTSAVWFASGTADHGRPYRNIGSYQYISLRSYTIVGYISKYARPTDLKLIVMLTRDLIIKCFKTMPFHDIHKHTTPQAGC